MESCHRDSSASGTDKKNGSVCFDTDHENIRTKKTKFENPILNALLHAFSEIFLKGHLRTSLLSFGEHQSMASFTLSRILLSELRKSTGNGVLQQMTASYICGNSYKLNGTAVCDDANNNGVDNDDDNNLSRPVYDIFASIISRAKSKNRDLAVSSTLLLSSVIRSSDLRTAAFLCDKREGDWFPSNSAVHSVQNTPNIAISVDNTPLMIHRESPMGLFRKIGSHVITDVRDFHRNLLIESINQENDLNDTENGEENEVENSNKDEKFSNDNSDITKWEKVEFENLESRLTRICEEIFFSDKRFNLSLNMDPLLRKNSEEKREINNKEELEKDSSKRNREKEMTEYDMLFSSKYTDVSACSITARLSSRLSSWLYVEKIDCISKSDDNLSGTVGSIETCEKKSEISTKIRASNEAKIKNQNEIINGNESECGYVLETDNKKGQETNVTQIHTRSILFDFILYRLAVFSDLRYEEQVALSSIIRETLCVLCSTLVDRSLNHDSNHEMEKKTETVERLKTDINTVNQMNDGARSKVTCNDFNVPSQPHHEDDILIFILNIIEITSSLRKDMKAHLKSVALHTLKIRVLHDILSTSSSCATLPLCEIKQIVANDKVNDKNSVSCVQDSGNKRREDITLLSQIIAPRDIEKSIIGPCNNLILNDDTVVLNDENCKLVSDETKQNKRILETTVILNELLRETQGMVFATNKLKFSLLTALNYSKSVIVFEENMKMDVNSNEQTEFESDDESEMDQNCMLKETVKGGNSKRKENNGDDDFDMIKDESLHGKKSNVVSAYHRRFPDTPDFNEKCSKISNEISYLLSSIPDRNEKCETEFLYDYEMLEKELLNIYD